MLTLNQQIKNNYGEILTPIAITGDNVVCVDLSGQTVNRKMADFSNASAPPIQVQQKQVIVPIELAPTDVIFTEEQATLSNAEAFSEQLKKDAALEYVGGIVDPVTGDKEDLGKTTTKNISKHLTFDLIAKVNNNGK